MFSGCSSLWILPDISIWNIKNVTDMSSMFSGCSSLSTLPDISKWGKSTSKCKDISYMFNRCISLSYLPDLTKFDFSSVKYKNGIFNDCFSSINLFDLSLINSNEMEKPNIEESEENSEFEGSLNLYDLLLSLSLIMSNNG